MHIQDIRSKAPFEEVDYLFLKDCLKTYEQPRKKITHFLKTKDLIRVKKGLYVFGPKGTRGPYSKEVLANLIYGPSAISFEYALSFYQLIPERVEEVTCITPKRNKVFDTPVGRFSYHHLHLNKYPVGIVQEKLLGNRNILIASQEKALCDMLSLKCSSLKNLSNLKNYLFENLRMEEDFMEKFDEKHLKELVKYYRNRNVQLLYKYYQEYQGKNNA